MRRGQQPGPATVGCSCVYVLRRPDGYFYAGSTEAIGDRLKSHRQVKPDVLNKYVRDRCVGQMRRRAGGGSPHLCGRLVNVLWPTSQVAVLYRLCRSAPARAGLSWRWLSSA